MDDKKLEELRDTISQLNAKIDTLASGIKKNEQKQRSLVRFLAPIISSVILSLAATYATWTYNARQVQLAQIEALDKYRSYLNSKDPKERKFGYQAFEELGYKEFVLKLIDDRLDWAGINITRSIESSGSTENINAAQTTDKIMANAASLEQNKFPSPISTSDIRTSKEGWVYLGHFVSEKSNWRTRYLNFSANEKPSNLVDKTLEVSKETGSLNVREGMPTFTGQFLEVQEVLAVGSSVTIIEYSEWHSSGYIWAKVRYGT